MEFKKSSYLSLGIELELQLVDKNNFDLTPKAIDFIKHFSSTHFGAQLVPEITQSMVELNSGVHLHPDSLLSEMKVVRHALVDVAKSIDVRLSGGGAHHFQMWHDRKLYPDPHFKSAGKKYGYLAKMFTVFGMHVHVGCSSGDDAIYLMNSLARYIPHFIALSASSPFCQGVDTGFDSSRGNVVSMFPLSGLAPVMDSWDAFCSWMDGMKRLKLAEKINNFYWDVRPKPEYGTVEVRVCDTPLTMERAVTIAAYVQCLSRYILEERPLTVIPHELLLYGWNRYQSSYHSFQAAFINPYDTQQKCTLQEDISATLLCLKPHARALGTEHFLDDIRCIVETEKNDAKLLRDHFDDGLSLKDIMCWQSQLFAGEMYPMDNVASNAQTVLFG